MNNIVNVILQLYNKMVLRTSSIHEHSRCGREFRMVFIGGFMSVYRFEIPQVILMLF